MVHPTKIAINISLIVQPNPRLLKFRLAHSNWEIIYLPISARMTLPSLMTMEAIPIRKMKNKIYKTMFNGLFMICLHYFLFDTISKIPINAAVSTILRKLVKPFLSRGMIVGSLNQSITVEPKSPPSSLRPWIMLHPIQHTKTIRIKPAINFQLGSGHMNRGDFFRG